MRKNTSKFFVAISLILILNSISSQGQGLFKRKIHRISINYEITRFTNNGNTVACLRTPQNEWKKIEAIGEEPGLLLTYILNVENFLQQRKSGVYTWDETYFNLNLAKLKSLLVQYKIELDLSGYLNEFDFYKRNPVKSAAELRQDAINKFDHDEQEKKRLTTERERREFAASFKYDSAVRAKERAVRAKERQDAIQDSIINRKKWIQQQLIQNRINEKRAFDDKQKRDAETILKAEARKAFVLNKYGNVDGPMILSKDVVIGWSEEMCLESWGKPKSINTTITSAGKFEQWVYSLKKYLYFENAKLTAIQK